MILLGPELLTGRLDVRTLALATQAGRVAILGPGNARLQATDPAQPLWAIVGKFIALANIGSPWWLSSGSLEELEAFRQADAEHAGDIADSLVYRYLTAASGMVTQAVHGYPAATAKAALNELCEPVLGAIRQLLSSVDTLKSIVRGYVATIIRQNFAGLVGLPAGTLLPQVLEALVQYHDEQGLGMEDTAHGLRAYLMSNFVDTAGLPIAMPVAPGEEAKVPDWLIRTRTILIDAGGAPSTVMT